MIVVTAPTGHIGSQVLTHLLATDQPVRVIARDPSKLPAPVRDRAEVITGTHADPQVVDQAFTGADTVFWVCPADRAATNIVDTYVEFTRPAADAIRTHGISRVVDITALGRGTPLAGHAGHVTGSLAMDDLLASTGVAFRAVACPSFMDNLLRQVVPLAKDGTFFDGLTPDRRLPTVATRDIAAVCATLLLDTSWTGQQEVPLLGPADLSPADQAAILTDVLGKPVRYQQVPDATTRERLLAAGMSEAVTQAMLDMMSAKEQGLDLGVQRTPSHVTQTPTTFHQWASEVLKPAVAAA